MDFPVHETERLILRQPTAEDEPEIFALYSKPEVTRFCELATLVRRAQAAALLRGFEAEFASDAGVRWAITERGSQRLIGLCGFGIHHHNYSALIDYSLEPEYWGRGIMTEAVRAVAEYAFERAEMNRLTATTMADNSASIRVLERVGFQAEGLLRDWAYWKGEFKDICCFSLLRRDRGPRTASLPIAQPRTSITELDVPCGLKTSS
jgi:[ribosomal protein S5]-alanine N-acetyltransferase